MNLKVVIEQLCKLIDFNNSVISIANIAMLNDGDEFLDSNSPIILSIVNIEEDKTLKNQSVYISSSNDNTKISRYKNPSEFFIISLLFSSYSKNLTKYLDGIEKLKTIMSFFQQNNSFYYKDDDTELITFENYLAKSETEKHHYFKITMEIVSLTMEQLNQMWSYLGSRYMPSVLYKMRFYKVQDSQISSDKVIKKIKIDLWKEEKDDPIGKLESGEYEPQP